MQSMSATGFLHCSYCWLGRKVTYRSEPATLPIDITLNNSTQSIFSPLLLAIYTLHSWISIHLHNRPLQMILNESNLYHNHSSWMAIAPRPRYHINQTNSHRPSRVSPKPSSVHAVNEWKWLMLNWPMISRNRPDLTDDCQDGPTRP